MLLVLERGKSPFSFFIHYFLPYFYSSFFLGECFQPWEWKLQVWIPISSIILPWILCLWITRDTGKLFRCKDRNIVMDQCQWKHMKDICHYTLLQRYAGVHSVYTINRFDQNCNTKKTHKKQRFNILSCTFGLLSETDTPLGGQGIGWLVTLKELQ